MEQLNSDEVYDKLMQIFNEREELYAQMEGYQKLSGNAANQRISLNAKTQPKTQSVEPVQRT